MDTRVKELLEDMKKVEQELVYLRIDIEGVSQEACILLCK